MADDKVNSEPKSETPAVEDYGKTFVDRMSSVEEASKIGAQMGSKITDHRKDAEGKRDKYALDYIMNAKDPQGNLLLGKVRYDKLKTDEEKEQKRQAAFAARQGSDYHTAFNVLYKNFDAVVKKEGKFVSGLENIVNHEEVVQRADKKYGETFGRYGGYLHFKDIAEKAEKGNLSGEEKKAVSPAIKEVEEDRLNKLGLQYAPLGYDSELIKAVTAVAARASSEFGDGDYKTAANYYKNKVEEELKKEDGANYIEKVREGVADALRKMLNDKENTKAQETAVALTYTALKSKPKEEPKKAEDKKEDNK